MTTPQLGERAIRVWSRPWFRPMIGVFVITVLLLAAPVYGWSTSGGKISADVSRDAETVSVVIVLPVDVTSFHRIELARFGVFSGRDRNNPTDRSRVRLQNVSQDDLETLARFYWVVGIENA